ncbi:MAG: dihydrodipicolinate synthase family protein, partial [Verrucomicrobia bacterium]|nr:dihydrodipicolinate synthase family protein [Verrucomicrobiota bacterium]
MHLSRRKFLALGLNACSGALLTIGATVPATARRLPRRAIIPAALTPFTSGLEVDLADYRRHITHLAAVSGVTGIMVNGAAGHDSTLSRDERRRLVAAAVAAADGRVAILAAVRENQASPSLAPFAKDATAEGAQALVVMPPADKGEFAWERAQPRFETVFAASSLPVAIYQTGYDTETLTRLAALPPIIAIKEGNGSPAVFERNLRSVRALGRDVAVWSTHSSWLLADLAVGADGILSGMGSVAAELHVALAEAVWRSDLEAARRVAERLFPLTQVFYRPGQDAHTRMKHALVRLGRMNNDLVRPPRQPNTDADRAIIDRALR